MNNELSSELITLIDDHGTEHKFEVLDVIENKHGCFYALSPLTFPKDASPDSDTAYFIFEAIDQYGETVLAEVEDDSLLDSLSTAFEEHFEDMYSINDYAELI